MDPMSNKDWWSPRFVYAVMPWLRGTKWNVEMPQSRQSLLAPPIKEPGYENHQNILGLQGLMNRNGGFLKWGQPNSWMVYTNVDTRKAMEKPFFKWMMTVSSPTWWLISLSKWLSSPQSNNWMNPTKIPFLELGVYPTYDSWVVRHQVGNLQMCCLPGDEAGGHLSQRKSALDSGKDRWKITRQAKYIYIYINMYDYTCR